MVTMVTENSIRAPRHGRFTWARGWVLWAPQVPRFMAEMAARQPAPPAPHTASCPHLAINTGAS